MASSLDAAVRFANRFAPEHLSIPHSEQKLLVEKLSAAGSVFLGPWSAQSIGDYASGTNHVLPTAGWRAHAGRAFHRGISCVFQHRSNFRERDCAA